MGTVACRRKHDNFAALGIQVAHGNRGAKVALRGANGRLASGRDILDVLIAKCAANLGARGVFLLLKARRLARARGDARARTDFGDACPCRA